ncbi:hypothetical protein GGH94_003055 [Coemansia aciculifera]|uniref:DUF4246 domain-containing protein n=1 Tax=Coemansia aciculifera TaxID=417176 RepID=A0A9W8IK37_9FUNG|nr:hypothetical protein GGH94_003055 [Coemansia aciculifera]KAJ2877011.1 hypothetical protein GGH93_000275 [Coemansia aciculifera]
MGRRTAIGIPPSATLDERIRGLFYSGAMYNCDPEAINTLAERRMRQMSSDIRSKSDWIKTLNDADTRTGWAAEAKTKGLTGIEFAYILDELVYYASLHPPSSNVRLSAADGVWFSDALIDADATNELRDYAAILENVPDRQKDWYPNDRSSVLNLIDPSLFPLIYSRSKLCRQTSTSPQAALKIEEAGEFPGSLDEWRKALNVTEDGESDYYLPTGVWPFVSYSSAKLSWLPSEFRVDGNGAVTIESYINNLHPVKHAAFYPIIASVFSKFLPLLEQVVTDLVNPRQRRVIPDSSKYYKSDEPLPDGDIDNGDDDYNHFEEIILWKRRATFVLPQPEPFVAPTRPVIPYKLSGRRLQAVVKMANIELTPKRPIYGGKDWGVVGLANERIIATGIFFYDMANIVSSSLQFREALCSWDFEAVDSDIEAVVKAYGMELDQFGEGSLISQELGSVGIKDGRCLVFPNIYQYKMPELELADKDMPGHCKMLTFYFVDPSTRIPSTELVPPQQQDWWVDDVLPSEPRRSLPHLVMNDIMAKVDFPISLEEAKKIRLLARQDETCDNVTDVLFAPEGSSRLVLGCVQTDSDAYSALLKPLLWLCHNFRAVAYSLYCNNFDLNLSSLSFDYGGLHPLRGRRSAANYRKPNYLGYSTHHLATDITVFLDERSVYSGEALEVISRAPYDGCPFPLTRKIAFIFVKDTTGRMYEDVWNDPSKAEANIDAFVNRIKQMAPLVGEITVQPAEHVDMPSIARQYFGNLTSRLYQLAYRIVYRRVMHTTGPVWLQLNIICNLIHVSYASDSSINSTYQFIQLARENASTLQSLEFKCEHYLDVLSLVQDAAGNHVAYPCLLTLTLWTEFLSEEPRPLAFHEGVPFPILQRLRINLGCQFDDDTFFRGNAATLEHLSMQLDSVSASMLHEYQVFVLGSHPKLQVVRFSYTDDFGSELFASSAEALQFMYNIGPCAAVREYSQAYTPANLEFDFTPLGSHACIQVLSLPNLCPDIWQVIALIKSLPLLSDLHTSMPSLGPMPDDVTLDSLPRHIVSNYAPIGRRFRCWHPKSGYVTNFTELTTCVLLLALVCPNFDYAVPPSFQRRLFMEILEKDINSDRFMPYAPRLRRLLFNRWDGKQG